MNQTKYSDSELLILSPIFYYYAVPFDLPNGFSQQTFAFHCRTCWAT